MPETGQARPMSLHRLVEARTVFGLVDGVGVGTDHLDAELVQDAVLFQVQGAVQRGLAAHGRQQGVRDAPSR